MWILGEFKVQILILKPLKKKPFEFHDTYWHIYNNKNNTMNWKKSWQKLGLKIETREYYIIL